MKQIGFWFSLFSPAKLGRFAGACWRHGTTLMALLAYAKANNPERIAVQDEDCRCTYKELYDKVNQLTHFLREKYQLREGQQVLLIGQNSVEYITSLFALSGIGVHVSLHNPSFYRPGSLLIKPAGKSYALVIADNDLDQSAFEGIPVLHTCQVLEAAESLSIRGKAERKTLVKSSRPGTLRTYTSGSTGIPKEIPRSPSLWRYADPLLSLTRTLKLQSYNSIFIAVPLFHGFGLATLLISMFFSKTIYIHRRFQAQAVANAIRSYGIDCVALVPLMLQKLCMQQPLALKCIVSGSDRLNPSLIQRTLDVFGPVLYNLYGTSEAGFSILATPADLMRFPETIGKAIRGTHVNLVDAHGRKTDSGEVGELAVSAAWSALGSSAKVHTGDLAMMNSEGYYFLKGRTDDLIIIGGENVYPLELESIVYQHPGVTWVQAEGYEDSLGVQQLHLKVCFSPEVKISANGFTDWLKSKVPKRLIPAKIECMEQPPHTKLL